MTVTNQIIEYLQKQQADLPPVLPSGSQNVVAEYVKLNSFINHLKNNNCDDLLEALKEITEVYAVALTSLGHKWEESIKIQKAHNAIDKAEGR